MIETLKQWWDAFKLSVKTTLEELGFLTDDED